MSAFGPNVIELCASIEGDGVTMLKLTRFATRWQAEAWRGDVKQVVYGDTLAQVLAQLAPAEPPR